MNKLALGIALSMCLVPFSASQAEEKAAGCGVGKIVLEGKSGVGINIAASLMNDMLSGSSSITSGTMGCDSTQTVMNDSRKEVFLAANMDNLSMDIAQGQGDYLDSLAAIMGIESKDKDSFFSLTQDNYQALLGDNSTDAFQLLASLETVMSTDAVLAKYIR